jgi:transcription-repair coupling factor (superfamily II helicase)
MTATSDPLSHASAPSTGPPLASLLPLLRDEPALLGTLGLRSATFAVPDPARAITIAAIATLSKRRPLIVAVPTSADAERLAADLAPFLGAHEVDVFPAWETLPFERVSPSVETMGRRLRTMWHLRDPERCPRVVVAPARALVQRLSPHVEDIEPIAVEPGSVVDQHALVERLVEFGYRREYQVEHRGELAVRGSIVDIFPSTADGPVRIDLWGDEVERLTTFAVGDQRSDGDVARGDLPVSRADAHRRPSGPEPGPWSTRNPGVANSGSGSPTARRFDGMESWLPWLAPDGEGRHVLFDMVGPDAQVVLVEPRRLRDRAAGILAEEADLAATLATTWGVGEGEPMPRLHLDFERLLANCEAPVWTMTVAPEGPGIETVAASAWFQVGGDGARLVGQLRDLSSTGYRIVVAADTAASAERADRLLREYGVSYAVRPDGGDPLAEPGGHVCVAALSRGVILPSVKLAILAEPDLTGRRRTHRPTRTSRRQAQTFFDDLTVGSYVVHHHHGVARFGGMVRRNIGGAERDYLLLEYRGEDRLYVPSDQIDAVRHYTGGDTPSLSKMGGSDFAKAKAKVRAEVAEIAQELVVLYQKRVHTKGHAFAEDSPWQAEMEDRPSPSPRPPTS